MATRARIELDQENQSITIRLMDDTDGSDATDSAKIVFKLTDVANYATILGLTGDDLEVRARLEIAYDADDACTRKARIIFASGWVAYDGDDV